MIEAISDLHRITCVLVGDDQSRHRHTSVGWLHPLDNFQRRSMGAELLASQAT